MATAHGPGRQTPARTTTNATLPRVSAGADLVPYCPLNAGAARAGSAALLAAARFHVHGQRQPRRSRWTGCPCGCLTRLPWFDDPDCVRHLPMPAPRELADYDVVALGLAGHDRDRCRECQAVGA